jgi:uncharacterized protein (DUF2147 family)
MQSMRTLSLFLFIAAGTVAAGPNNGVLGDWKNPTGSILRMEPCDPAVCLRVVRVSPTAPAATDIHNPDAALRSRALCGLVVGTDFRQDDATHLSDGRLYDPISGHTYRGNITVEGNSLVLRGYIGIPLFGRSETWQRVEPVTACNK